MRTLRVDKEKLIKVNKAKGIYLFTKDKKILDLTAGGTSHCILGWDNQKINDAIKKQLKIFSHINYKFWDDTNVEILSKLLTKNINIKLDQVYFSGNSGSESCEAAMKLSYLTHLAEKKRKKKWFIGRDQSYHGITTDALSISERPNLEIYKPLLSKYRTRIKQHHYLKEARKGETREEYSFRSSQELKKKIEELGPENVSAFVGETMMGGLIGDVPPEKNYWKYIRKICDDYDVHLILDECYCGLGSSGKLHSIEWDGVTPDFLFVAKTLTSGYVPLGAVLTTSKIKNSLFKFNDRIQHGSTFQGHSLGVAAGIATQNIVNNKKMLKEINSKGIYMRKILSEELGDHPFFFDLRGRGLRFSLEYSCKNKNNFGLSLFNKMLYEDSIYISAKWHRICFTPAYTITFEECDFVLDRLIKKFKNLASNWK